MEAFSIVRRGLVAVLGIGGNVVSTAAPAVELARLPARGELHASDVVAPEQVLDPSTFLPALSRIGCRVSVVRP